MIKIVDRARRTRDIRSRPDVPERVGGSLGQRGSPAAVVELFTSEGCSSCPPADELLSAIAEEAREQRLPVFALGFHVDYWDFQGWPDRFATPANTARQTTYAGMLGNGNLYTPQMVVNGVAEFVGYRSCEAWKHIDAALAQPASTSLSITLDRPAAGGSTLLIAYDVDDAPAGVVINTAVIESGLDVKVEAGENIGLTLHHDNAVRVFEAAPLRGKRGSIAVELPAELDPANSAVVAYAQLGKAGRIIAATSAPLPTAARRSDRGGDE